MEQTNTAIRVNGLEKSFKGHKVLKGVRFCVQKGQIFTLLGSNGAGKTTTIKILTTLLKPDSGSAQVGGFDVVRDPARVRRQISLTGQYAALDEVLTGRENLRMIGRLRRLPDARQRAEEMLGRFDLLDAANKPAAAYSGGMRRRLDLAMSLMGNPPVLFLDEPTTGLDPQSRLAMWKIIKGLSRNGTTVFLTTQYLEEAEKLADSIAILNDGRIVAEGTATELKKILPHGHMALRFHEEEQSRAALALLIEFGPKWDDENQTLVIATDGSAKQTAQILGLLENARISVAEFAHRMPTLENVFLSVIGHNHNKEKD